MGIKQVMVSDISGAEGSPEEFTTLTVRVHPAIDEPKALDIKVGELDKLKSQGDLVVLEIGSNGDKKKLVVTVSELRKLIPDDVVKSGRATRGRRPGTRVT